LHLYIQLIFHAGNEWLYWLIRWRRYRLRIVLGDRQGKYRKAEYDNFKLGNFQSFYKLRSLGRFSGDAG